MTFNLTVMVLSIAVVFASIAAFTLLFDTNGGPVPLLSRLSMGTNAACGFAVFLVFISDAAAQAINIEPDPNGPDILRVAIVIVLINILAVTWLAVKKCDRRHGV